MPIGAGLPSPAALLFNRPIRGLSPQMNRGEININNDDAQYEVHKPFKVNTLRTMIFSKTHSFAIGSAVATV